MPYKFSQRSVRLLYDLQPCQTKNSSSGGVGRYTGELFSHIVKESSNLEVLGLCCPHHPYTPTVSSPSSHVVSCPPLPDWGSNPDFLGGVSDTLDSLLLSSFIGNIQPDIVHISNVFDGLTAQCPLPCPSVRPVGQVLSVMLYDFIPLLFSDHYFADACFERWYRHKLSWLHQADLFLSPSDSTRQDAIELGFDPEKIVTIGAGVSEVFCLSNGAQERSNGAQERFRKKYDIKDNFVLCPSNNEYRKNPCNIVRAYVSLPEKIRKRYKLVFFGRFTSSLRDEIFSICATSGVRESRVCFLGFVTDQDLVDLYTACSLFVFPSLYEGFGIPLVEAMAQGAPAIGSNTSSIKSIIARQDALFDPRDPEKIASCMKAVLESPNLSQDLREYGLARSKDYTWKKTAHKAIEAFDNALERKKKAGTCAALTGWLPRPRLAWLTPFPPMPSSIADYIAEFLPYLSCHFEIDIYVDTETLGKKTISAPELASFRVFDVKDLPAHAEGYDVFLYEVGNSAFHAHMFPLLRDYPGIVMLHDAFLSGLQHHIQDVLGQENHFFKEVLYSHGSQARSFLSSGISDESLDTCKQQLPCTKGVLDQALGIISHTSFNLDVARQNYPEGWKAPYRIIPHMMKVKTASEDKKVSARTALGFSDDDFLIVTFGHSVLTKMPHELLEAFAESECARDQTSYLLFVGSLEDDYAYKLKKRVKSLKLTSKIRLTKCISYEDYEKYLYASDLAVQLRKHPRGGMSGALLRCLAYGLPTIINRGFQDFPDDTVYMLPSAPTVDEIAQALVALKSDRTRLMRLAQKGQAHIRSHHDPRTCAAQYASAICEMTSSYKASKSEFYEKHLITHLKEVPKKERACRAAARFLDSRPMLRYARPRLFIDVSHITQYDHKSGIQRVVREMVRAGYLRSKPGIETVAVRREGDHLVEATEWLMSLGLLLPSEDARQERIVFHPGDQLFMLDSSWYQYDDFHSIFAEARQSNVPIITFVHDILQITLPEYFGGVEATRPFEAWLRKAICGSDSLMVSSKVGVQELKDYIAQHNLGKECLTIDVCEFGSEIKASSGPVSPTVGTFLKKTQRPFMLMVGTIEPRKSHALALGAFERLWEQGFPMNLVIAGRKGWMMESVLDRLEGHPLLGERVFFVEEPEDQDITELYKKASSLLYVSKAEGYGLPLIEAAHYGTHVVCSDIPLFHEIMGEHAAYVSIETPEGLSDNIREWYATYEEGSAPSSSGLKLMSWEDSFETVLDVLFKKEHRSNFVPPRPRLFIDASHIAQGDLKSGIQRVVREMVRAGYLRSQPGIETVAVRREGDHLVEAKEWLKSIGFPSSYEKGKKIEFRPGDQLFMLDSSGPDWSPFKCIFSEARQSNVPIITFVHDILPMLIPECFYPSASKEHASWFQQAIQASDSLMVSSKVGAQELKDYIAQHNLGKEGLTIDVCEFGSEIKASSGPVSPTVGTFLKKTQRPFMLMVGTIEPRKNHALALGAFERLWEQGFPMNLVIAGRKGWMMESVLDRLEGHPLLGERVFFVEEPEDQDITELYKKASSLLYVSKAEGYGLPLIEAAHYGTHVVCSDIPLFHEIMGEHAAYVSIETPEGLSDNIREWYATYEEGSAPSSSGLKLMSWEDSFETVLDVLFKKEFS